MMNFKKYISGGAAFAGSALILSSTLAVAPAQAASIYGTVNISGSATFANPNEAAPATDTIKFLTSVVDTTTTGSFTSLIGTSATVSDVNLVKSGSSSTMGSWTATSYTGTASNPLIQFANGLKFDINNSFNVLRLATSGFTLAATEPFSGTFYNSSGVAVGNGLFTVNSIGSQGSYSATIEAVPEPFTILGSATALGFGAFLKKKRAEKQKQATVSA
ncbi:PEP-CTERM sorting domain-containing protein [Cylindrospermum sp. FACHB-282]|uniref:PEP-CTERM sorting domain-containing protein n=1 Tax=Cylindrospermum sp. FACHB-282 TaxID=2692794 RepID=UPI001681D532|nr:PEP-CTERM sorting domain-containing protein [Cylindrospermum sp. FACHB-282]MBD2385871.1 PEP-CTERM sorting domain-containing protein [Cylindrospermum sp. FACHB-282]